MSLPTTKLASVENLDNKFDNLESLEKISICGKSLKIALGMYYPHITLPDDKLAALSHLITRTNPYWSGGIIFAVVEIYATWGIPFKVEDSFTFDHHWNKMRNFAIKNDYISQIGVLTKDYLQLNPYDEG